MCIDICARPMLIILLLSRAGFIAIVCTITAKWAVQKDWNYFFSQEQCFQSMH